MKSKRILIVGMFLLIESAFFMFSEVPAKNVSPDWRDAPAMGFETLKTDGARAMPLYQGSAIPSIPNPSRVKQPLVNHSKMLNACADKFGGDIGALRDSFLRIPKITRNLFVAREKKCRGAGRVVSETNCSQNLKCVRAVVKFEKTVLTLSGAKDDAYVLYGDARGAAFTYKLLTRREVSYYDSQDYSLKANWRRFVNSGYARFNPNQKETEALRDNIKAALGRGKLNQMELIHEAIATTKGNFTLGMGSLAEIFHDNRQMISKISGMRNAAGKNYYRFVGMYVGLHESAAIRNLGQIAGYANIAGNPIAYGVARTASDFWKATKYALKYYGLRSDENAEAVDFKETLGTFGPEGRGNYIDKFPEYTKGLSAAIMYRKNQ